MSLMCRIGLHEWHGVGPSFTNFENDYGFPQGRKNRVCLRCGLYDKIGERMKARSEARIIEEKAHRESREELAEKLARQAGATFQAKSD